MSKFSYVQKVVILTNSCLFFVLFFPVVYNFQAEHVQQALQLDVGETVQILEESSGEYLRCAVIFASPWGRLL